MKKALAFLLILSLLFTFAACSKPVDSKQEPAPVSTDTEPDPAGQESNNEPFVVSADHGNGYADVAMNRFPSSVADLEGISLDDEYVSAAVIIAVLAYYETDPETCFEMVDYMMGPEDISAFDKSFIKGQFLQYPYVARSYVTGASPSNDYVADPVVYHITENSYSRDEDGYVKLFLQSGGADSPRGVTVRHKESTDQWFLFSDTYKGLLAGIREPESNDKWK